MQDQTPPAAPATPAAPAAPDAPAVAPTAGQPAAAAPRVVIPGAAGEGTATEAYLAQKAMRDELGDQLERLQEQRAEILRDIRRSNEQGVGDAARTGLEARLAALDTRILALDGEIAAADAAVAQAAAVPGAVIEVPPPPVYDPNPNEELIAIGMFLSACVLFPLSIAYARRLWKRSAAAVTALPAELMHRLGRMEQGMDAMAIEVERISEGQRFMTRIFSESTERRALGAEVPLANQRTDTPI